MINSFIRNASAPERPKPSSINNIESKLLDKPKIDKIKSALSRLKTINDK